jgi:AAA15 family ATPase/GTPase
MSEANPSKLTSVELTNFGPLRQLVWPNLADINLIIGTNGSGKTFLLKALYTFVKTLEGAGKGNEYREPLQLIKDKFHWVFQTDSLFDLVSHNQRDMTLHLSFKNLLHAGEERTKKIELSDGSPYSIDLQEQVVSFFINTGLYDTPSRITKGYGLAGPDHLAVIDRRKKIDSIFLPPKESLSVHKIIRFIQERYKEFGYDTTYYDLAQALDWPALPEPNEAFASSRQKLQEEILKGRIVFNKAKERWEFVSSETQQHYPMGVVAEGIKKIGVLDVLLANDTLTPGSIVFMDEPESALHPEAISQLLAIVHQLSQQGIQFFMATHSYFVIKELYLLAQENNTSVACLSLSDKEEPQTSDLLDGMPENGILNHAIKLYERGIDL